MKKINKTLKKIAMILVVVGGLNWGLVGLLQFNLVSYLAGLTFGFVSTFIYSLVGLSALYLGYSLIKEIRGKK